MNWNEDSFESSVIFHISSTFTEGLNPRLRWTLPPAGEEHIILEWKYSAFYIFRFL